MDREEAVDRAIEECIREGILTDFLRTHRTEVKMDYMTDWDEEYWHGLMIRDARAEGLAEGRAEGVEQTLLGLVREGMLSVGYVAEKLNKTESEVEALLAVNAG